MCKDCSGIESTYPDVGTGAMLNVKNERIWLSSDIAQGVRISQTRHVDFIGPEGAVSRDETQCVYIGWDDIEAAVTMLLLAEHKNELRKKDETPDP